MFAKVAAVFNLIVILFWLHQWGSFASVFADSSSVQAASEETPACEIAGKAEGQTLYSCIVDGTMCAWDPSPTLGAGVLDCDW